MKFKIISAFGFLFILLFVQSISARLNVYPNELRGLRFFNKGKLKGVKLAVTTRDEVVEIFGESCENSCDYNDKWSFQLLYFDHIEKGSTDYAPFIKYVPASQYLDKIYWIKLRPKTNISFEKVTFSSIFSKGNGFTIGDAWDNEGFQGAKGTSYFNYQDKYGLNYKVFRKIVYTVGKASTEPDKRVQGDLSSIEYEIPAELEEKMFVEKK